MIFVLKLRKITDRTGFRVRNFKPTPVKSSKHRKGFRVSGLGSAVDVSEFVPSIRTSRPDVNNKQRCHDFRPKTTENYGSNRV